MPPLKIRRPAFGVIVALTVAVCVPLSRSPRAQAPGGTEVDAIRKVLDQQARDWNAGNLDGFLEGYWASPKVVFQSGGDRNVGFDAMRARYRKSYKAEGRSMGRLVFSELEIEPLAPDTAFARGRWGLTMPEGKTPGGLFTLVLRKFPEGWKIIHDHTSSAEPPAPKPG